MSRFQSLQIILLVALLSLVTACNKHSGINEDAVTTNEPDSLSANTEEEAPSSPPFADLSNDTLVPPQAPSLSISAAPGALLFTWDNPGLDSRISLIRYNRTLQSFTPFYESQKSRETDYRLAIAAHRFDWKNTLFLIEVCDSEDCLRSYAQNIEHLRNRVALALPSNSGTGFDLTGTSLALSGNGNVLFAGAPGHDGERTEDTGAVMTWFRIKDQWWFEATITAASPVKHSQLGASVVVSDTGDTLVAGSPTDGTDGDLAGSVSIFERLGEGWFELQRLSGGTELEQFGSSLALNKDGTFLCVGAPGAEDGSGRVYCYKRELTGWMLKQILSSRFSQPHGRFGQTVAINGSGDRLVIGSAETPIVPPGESGPDTVVQKGTVQVLDQIDGKFGEGTALQPTDATTINFGRSVTMNEKGNLIIVSLLSSGLSMSSTRILEKPHAHIVVYEKLLNNWEPRQTLTPGGVHSTTSHLTVASDSAGDTIVAGLTDSTTGHSAISTFIKGSSENDPERAELWILESILNEPAEIIEQNTDPDASLLPMTGSYSGFAEVVTLSNDGEVLATSSPFGPSSSNTKNGQIYLFQSAE